jgi:hypothetical protein
MLAMTVNKNRLLFMHTSWGLHLPKKWIETVFPPRSFSIQGKWEAKTQNPAAG